MTELEKVEKLREKADVSFAEAKEALDNAGGDVLGALIYLESQGKTTVPAGGGFFSSAGGKAPGQGSAHQYEKNKPQSGESFGEMMKRFGSFCMKMLNKGNSNFLDAKKNDNLAFSCPVTALVALLLFLFWVTIPLFIISLFCGYRYSFRGADLGRDSVNRVMENAATVVEDVKNSFTGAGAGVGSGAGSSDNAEKSEDSGENAESGE